jgi:hypothetical protein
MGKLALDHRGMGFLLVYNIQFKKYLAPAKLVLHLLQRTISPN